MNRQKKDIFETLFRDYYQELFLHALSFVRNEEEARDIVNDVFEYVLNNLQKLDDPRPLRPFLYSLTRNRSIDYLRHEKAKERFKMSHGDVLEESVEYSRNYEELIQRVMVLVESLPVQTRAVFRKCFIERKKYKEAGEELNISVNTVRTHISKALRILRNEFSDEEALLLFLIIRKIQKNC